MQKLKSIKLNGVFNIIKCCLIGIVTTLLGTVIFAFVLKFASLSSKFISYINDFIKTISIFVMIMCVKKSNGDKLLLKALFSGVVYALLAYVIFSILNGSFVFNLSFLYDLLFAVIVAMIVSVIINIVGHKSV